MEGEGKENSLVWQDLVKKSSSWKFGKEKMEIKKAGGEIKKSPVIIEGK